MTLELLLINVKPKSQAKSKTQNYPFKIECDHSPSPAPSFGRHGDWHLDFGLTLKSYAMGYHHHPITSKSMKECSIRKVLINSKNVLE